MNNSSVITTDNSEEYSLDILNARNVVLSPIFLLIILITIVGNLFVIISVIIEKSLRTPSNCLIFSLAIADLIVGIIVMPMRAVIVVFGHWPFEFRCDITVELTIMMAMASVLHLVAIAIDRYIIVSKIPNSNPLLSSRSKARIGVMLIFVWFIPALYSSLPLLGWHDKNYERRNKEFNCIGSRLMGYKIMGFLITYYIPAIIIIIFYSLIYQIASKSTQQKRKHVIQQIRLNGRPSEVEWDSNEYQNRGSPHQTSCRQSCVTNLSFLKKLTHNTEEREKKVAKTLSIITSVFLLCWSPYFIWWSIYMKEEYFHLNYWINQAIIWCGLCNSALNPIIYAYFVPTFRSAFKRIIRFRK